MSCSECKVPAKGLMRAIDRYDGPAFRVLRKYLRAEPEDAPTVVILSARYGLISADRRIRSYDCRLSGYSAGEIRPQVLKTARTVIESKQWRVVGICAGRVYRAALDGFEDLIPRGVQIDFINGGLGLRLTSLRKWLLQRD